MGVALCSAFMGPRNQHPWKQVLPLNTISLVYILQHYIFKHPIYINGFLAPEFLSGHLLSKNRLIYYGNFFWIFFCQILTNFSWNFIKLLNFCGCAGNWQFQASYIHKWISGPVIFFGKWHTPNYYFGHAIWQKKISKNFYLIKMAFY